MGGWSDQQRNSRLFQILQGSDYPIIVQIMIIGAMIPLTKAMCPFLPAALFCGPSRQWQRRGRGSRVAGLGSQRGRGHGW
jgi:hypothetical protein